MKLFCTLTILALLVGTLPIQDIPASQAISDETHGVSVVFSWEYTTSGQTVSFDWQVMSETFGVLACKLQATTNNKTEQSARIIDGSCYNETIGTINMTDDSAIITQVIKQTFPSNISTEGRSQITLGIDETSTELSSNVVSQDFISIPDSLYKHLLVAERPRGG